MDRREVFFALGGMALTAAGAIGVEQPKLPPFWTSRLNDVDQALQQLKKGAVGILAQSAGKRNLYLVTYGPKQERLGRANYNSACGGMDPASYARKNGKQRPVIFLLGPVHG